jgi:hypothetical protein
LSHLASVVPRFVGREPGHHVKLVVGFLGGGAEYSKVHRDPMIRMPANGTGTAPAEGFLDRKKSTVASTG